MLINDVFDASKTATKSRQRQAIKNFRGCRDRGFSITAEYAYNSDADCLFIWHQKMSYIQGPSNVG